MATILSTSKVIATILSTSKVIATLHSTSNVLSYAFYLCNILLLLNALNLMVNVGQITVKD